MRWMWIDRFTEFKRGTRATALKCVSMVEEEVDDYISGFPHFPPTLTIEGLAQTAGLLIGEKFAFKERIILAKVAKVKFHKLVLPGDTLTYTAIIDDIKADAAFCTCTSHLNGEIQAELDVVFAMLDGRFPDPIFKHADFLSMIRAFGLYDVGVDDNGQPLEIPDYLLQAEREAYAC
jgi:3-hydroxyacyl-[acyl-carrier-protein] dehydratase